MATRGNIVFVEKYEENIEELNYPTIYVHWDMFPESALEWITDFLRLQGAISRKYDNSYLTAWLIYYYITNNSYKSLDDDDFSGIGVEYGINSCSEYIYIIEPITKENKNFKITVLTYDFLKYGECLSLIHI